MASINQKVETGQRISAEEAIQLFDLDLITLGQLADISRKHHFPGETVGFIIDRIINYTNKCEANCAFCAFHANAATIKPYELTLDEIMTKVDELVEAGGSQVMLQGGLHPKNTLDKFLEMVKTVKGKYPDLFLHSFSPSEIVHVSKKESVPVPKIIEQLKYAGLDSIPGASDLLVQRVRDKVSPNKATVHEWQDVIQAIADAGMKSSATMTYGMGETNRERIEHLEIIRITQDKTGAIRRAKIPGY